MASRQLLRRVSPILRGATRARVLSVTQPPAVDPGHAAARQGPPISPSTLVRCLCVQADAPPEIIHIQDDEDFTNKVLHSNKLIIVDFHAHWCGPCKLLDPRLEVVVAEEKGRVTLAKVDIDENVEIAMRFKIQSVPTVLAFKDGKILGKFIGLKEFDEVKNFVKGLE